VAAGPLAFSLAIGLAVLVLAAAWCDTSARRLPNAICGLILAGYPAIFATAAAPQPVWGGVGAGAAVFAVGIAVFAAGWLGGGDVKLLSVLALWAGPAHLAGFLLITVLAGGVLAVGALIYGRLVTWVPVLAVGGEPTAQPTLPYGVAIACGGLWVAYTVAGAA